MRRPIIPYNPKLKDYAKQRRKKMTLAEVLLWGQLKQRKMCGHDFDRQRPIDEYIVDFFCKELRLAIEVDGWTHGFKRREDNERQRRLERLGVRFLRFWDHEVKSDLRSVCQRIEAWIRENERDGKA